MLRPHLFLQHPQFLLEIPQERVTEVFTSPISTTTTALEPQSATAKHPQASSTPNTSDNANNQDNKEEEEERETANFCDFPFLRVSSGDLKTTTITESVEDRIRPHVLLEMQSELYQVLPVGLRHKIHQMYVPFHATTTPSPSTANATTAATTSGSSAKGGVVAPSREMALSNVPVPYCSLAADPTTLLQSVLHWSRTHAGITDPSKGFYPPEQTQPNRTSALNSHSTSRSHGAAASSPAQRVSAPPRGLVFLSDVPKPPAPLKHILLEQQQQQELHKETQAANIAASSSPSASLAHPSNEKRKGDLEGSGSASRAAAPSIEVLAFVAFHYAQSHADDFPSVQIPCVPSRTARNGPSAVSSGQEVYYRPEEYAPLYRYVSRKVYRSVFLTDSRVAAEVYELCLRRGGIALPYGAKLCVGYHRPPKKVRGGPPPLTPSSTAPLDVIPADFYQLPRVHPEEVLQKVAALRQRYNLDEDLYNALVEGWETETRKPEEEDEDSATEMGRTASDCPPKETPHAARMKDIYQEVASEQEKQLRTGGTAARLMTTAMLHERHVSCALRFMERAVHYAAVLNDDEEASPFLLSLGFFLTPTLPWEGLREAPLTMEDLFLHVLRHPRRLIQALGLYLVRYVVPPEEWGLYFCLALGEDVGFPVTPFGNDTTTTSSSTPTIVTLATLAKLLLQEEEVHEAWLPRVHPTWITHVVRPAVEQLTAFWSSKKALLLQVRDGAASRDTRSTASLEDLARVAASSQSVVEFALREAAVAAVGGASKPTTASSLSHRGGGVAQGKGLGLAGRFGFQNLREVAQYVEEAQRTSRATHVEVLGHSTSGHRLRLEDVLSSMRRRGREAHHTADGTEEEGGQASQKKRRTTLVSSHRRGTGDDTGLEEGDDEADSFLDRLVVDEDAEQGGVSGALLAREERGSKKSNPTIGSSGTDRTNNKKSGTMQLAAEEATLAQTTLLSPAVDLHREAQIKGYLQLMSLMGRSKVFDRKNEHYFEF